MLGESEPLVSVSPPPFSASFGPRYPVSYLTPQYDKANVQMQYMWRSYNLQVDVLVNHFYFERQLAFDSWGEVLKRRIRWASQVKLTTRSPLALLDRQVQGEFQHRHTDKFHSLASLGAPGFPKEIGDSCPVKKDINAEWWRNSPVRYVHTGGHRGYDQTVTTLRPDG